MTDALDLPNPVLRTDIKERVRRAQARAVMSATAGLIALYWAIGRRIDARRRREGWGTAGIPRLARDLRQDMPEEKGFSERNIKRMRSFYREYGRVEFSPRPVAQGADAGPTAAEVGSTEVVPQPVAQPPRAVFLSVGWGHHDLLMTKARDLTTRAWYMRAFGAGKVNLYCNLVDDQLRHEGDGPTIGRTLCQEPDRLFAEYTLRGFDKPIGVSSYELTKALPTGLESSLPTIEQIEHELQDGEDK